MRNITIVVDEEVAEWARVYAARQGSSVSKVVGEMLREYMEQERAYDAAMLDYMSRSATALKESSSSYPNREDVHDR